MTCSILVGDVRQLLRTLPSESVQCVVTSPPYYGLRDYQVAGQIGLEPTPDAFIAEMVAVFAQIRRVLRKDGVAWVNMGDSYASGNGGTHKCGASSNKSHTVQDGQPRPRDPPGIKPKDRLMMPARLALALQADGWWLRDEIVWHKLQPMPESVRDRTTSAHEMLYLLTKSARYHYDAAAISEACGTDTHARIAARPPKDGRRITAPKTLAAPAGRRRSNESFENAISKQLPARRNKRSVWSLASEGFPGLRCAAFPTALVVPCILAGARRGDLVLDPFGGSGTVGLVAERLGRDSILIELHPAYAARAQRRIKAGIGACSGADEGIEQLALFDR